MDLDHIGDHLTAGQTVVDSICSLAFTVADIGTVITCSENRLLLRFLCGLLLQGYSDVRLPG